MSTHIDGSATARALRFITAALILSGLLLTIGAPQSVYADAINDAFQGCGVITFDSDAQGFRTASTFDNRTVNQGPFDAPHTSGSLYFRWEGTGGNPSGHLRADDLDGQWQEVWTPVFTDSNFSGVIGQQIQFDYKNDTGYNQYRLYIAIVGANGNQYYYYFNGQLGSVGSWSRVKVPMVASAWHTGFEAGENPSTPPDSPAPSDADFAAVLGNLNRFAISVEGISGPDTSRFDNFGRACDYGDLPESGTSFVTTGANAARHNIADEVRLGALIDSEPDGHPSIAADGDDSAFSDDEDSVASFPPLPTSPANYSVTVAVHNTSQDTATVYGWIDLNGNGILEPAEAATASVASNGTVSSVALTWTSVNASAQAALSTYARIRMTTFPLTDDGATPADERAQGLASDGEVEDYQILAPDFGDAPASYGAPAHAVLPSTQHAIGTPNIDGEPAPLHSIYADGDDNDNRDDENGVTLSVLPGRIVAEVAVIDFTGSDFGNLCGWLDGGNGGALDGAFQDGEGQCVDVSPSSCHVDNALRMECTFTWDVSALPASSTSYARFRLTTGPLTVADHGAGQAPDGEVEDYRIIDIQNLDASDAPGTAAAPVDVGGVLRRYEEAAHVLITPDLYLGTVAPDLDPVSRANAAADGDDTTGVDDEEGVSFTVGLGVSAQIIVTNGTGQEVYLYGFVDGQTSLNGIFGVNEGKEVKVPASGNNTACQEVSASPRRFVCTLSWTSGDLTGLNPGDITFARVRVAPLSTVRSATTLYLGGEVEDYRIEVPPQDTGDAPASYGDALHDIIPGAPHLGVQAPDAETQVLYSSGADGDDLNQTPDDEDGALRIGGKAGAGGWTNGTVASGNGGGVAVNIRGAAACLGAFVDFNRNGDFADPGEAVQLYDTNGVAISQPIAILAFPAYFDVPAGTFTGAASQLYGRYRVASPVNGNCFGSPAYTPTGSAPDGEVEDYLYSFSPAAVTVASFDAVQQDDAVLVTWETASELNNRGFNLYRGTSLAGPDRQLNATLIPSQSQGNPGGFIYTWEDRAELVPGTTYFYWVEDVDIYGVATRHGPVSVDFTAPTAVVLSGMKAAADRPAVVAWPWLLALMAVAMAAALVVWRRRNAAA